MTSQVREKLKSMEARYEEQLRMVGDPAVQGISESSRFVEFGGSVAFQAAADK